MSATEVLVDKVNGNIIDQDDPNSIHRALEGDFVGRDSSGAPTANQSLGTAIIPWGNIYGINLILDGIPVDPTLITSLPNRVVSGAIRSTSEFPDYLRPAGTGGGASFTVLGATTTLKIDVNGMLTDITTDIVKSGLATAPGASNTCLINDTGLTGQDNTRFLGENGSIISVDNMGSELTGKIGEFVALLNQATGEIFYCRIASTTKLDHCRRGLFFDSSGSPIPAAVLSNNNVLQILSLGFIFAEDNSASIDATYTNPVISGVEPSSPAIGDYWYDLSLNIWKRYNGSAFVQIDRTFIGTAVIDTADCIGARPEYFSKGYQDTNTLSVSLETLDIVVSDMADFIVSVDGKDKRFDFGFFRWDAATDFESGFTRTADRDYWLYITENGKPIISGYKPYDVRSFLRGWYHPYESWRAVAELYNTGPAANNFDIVHNSDENLFDILFNQDVEFFDFITLSNNVSDPLHDIDTTAGKFILDNMTRQFSAPAFTKLLDGGTWEVGSGNPGRGFATSLAADSTYHYFALSSSDGSIVDFGLDNNLAASSLLNRVTVQDAGLTQASYQGSILTDASADIIPFFQDGNRFQYKTRIRDRTSSSVSTSGEFLALSVPSGINVLAIINAYWRTSPVQYLLLTSPDENNDVADGTRFTFESGSNFRLSSEMFMKTNTSGQIRERSNLGGAVTQYFIWTLGYINLQRKT